MKKPYPNEKAGTKGSRIKGYQFAIKTFCLANIGILFTVWLISFSDTADVENSMYSYYDRHFKWVILTALLTVIIIALALFSWISKKAYTQTSWIIVLLQIARLFSSNIAINGWPGGDDGGMMFWGWFVNPPIWIIAIGALIYLIHLNLKYREENSRTPRLFQ